MIRNTFRVATPFIIIFFFIHDLIIFSGFAVQSYLQLLQVFLKMALDNLKQEISQILKITQKVSFLNL